MLRAYMIYSKKKTCVQNGKVQAQIVDKGSRDFILFYRCDARSGYTWFECHSACT